MLVPVPDPVKGRKWRECDGCGLHRKPRPRVDGELHPGDHPEDDGGHRPSAAAGARGPSPAGGRGRPAAGLVDEKELLRYTPSEATTLDVYELHDVLEKMTVGRIACPAHGSVAPDAPLGEAAQLMLSTRSDVVPVVDGGCLLGLVTSASLVAAAAGVPVPAGDPATPAGLRA